MNTPETSPATSTIPHVLSPQEQAAVAAARLAGRPLLVRGEPGTGKTQLAEAAAQRLNRPLVSLTVNSTTSPTDLLWTFDAVQRLAEAQVAAAITKDPQTLREQIQLQKFVKPGPLWWAFDWDSAAKQTGVEAPAVPTGWLTHHGVVILIDEIDKGETDVPNGLLEALGSRRFTPVGWPQPIQHSPASGQPLIVITTNEERALPDAFVRRCLVLQLELPTLTARAGEEQRKQENQALSEFLVSRGQAHFGHVLAPEILQQAADLLVEDRRTALENQQRPFPGQAEYLDYLRILAEGQNAGGLPQEQLQEVRSLVFRKWRKAVR